MKKWRKLLGLFMAGTVLITGGALPQKREAYADGVTDYGISSPRIENGVTTWDKIKFGSYRQDLQPAEPVKWRVLSVDGDDALLLADKILDVKPYNDKKEDVTWEICTLRKWLNEDFYKEAFDAEEQNAIKKSVILNNGSYSGTADSNDTEDNVFLLSAREAGNPDYGFGEALYESSKSRIAKNTDYAKANGSYNGAGDTVGNGAWWLRTPGNNNDTASYVTHGGYGYTDGWGVDTNVYGVRPALHVNLSSSKVIDAGQVDSEGNVTISDGVINNPTTEAGVTTWDCVYFGDYIQNISEKQEIEWRVLSVDGDDAFLLADKSLDFKPYNDKAGDATWETCALRKWLNEDFYNEAFDDEEKEAVIETTTVNGDNPGYGTNGGNNTQDKVNLLSIMDTCNAAYGFDKAYIEGSETRKAQDTDYAKAKGAFSNNYDGYGRWWLRSPGNGSDKASNVFTDGYVFTVGSSMNDDGFSVRPSIHINLSSSAWSKAGSVTAVRNTDKLSEEPTEYGISGPRIKNGIIEWDKIKFGSYYQENGKFLPAPIKWRVLSVDGDNALLLADKVLDAKEYNEVVEDVTWETCTLRTWLNEDFYNNAFDDEEKKAISKTTVVNNDNPDSGTAGGNETTDYVYLLSIEEAGNKDYGFDTELDKKSKTREAQNTHYANLNGAYNNTVSSVADNGYWWLRSPGITGRYASNITHEGYGKYDVNYVNDCKVGVRPALHINLKSSNVTYAGKVDSEGNVTMSDGLISNPSTVGGVTTWDCVYFGNYRQEYTFDKQALEWRVLSVDGNDAFLLAEKILDAKPYNDESKGVTWETCSLRKWLNEDFYNEAFDNEEKEAINETIVINEDNLNFGIEGGNNTKDRVYLLSTAEAVSADFGFDTFYAYSRAREAKKTYYAKLNNVYSGIEGSTVDNGVWWLRSPGKSSDYVSSVSYNGGCFDEGIDVSNRFFGVRPVLHINLSSSSWSSAGQVSSNGEVTEPAVTPSPAPTEEPENTAEPTQEPTKEPDKTEEPKETAEPTQEPTKEPDETEEPTVTAEPTREPEKQPEEPDKVTTPAGPATLPPVTDSKSPMPTITPVMKQVKLSSVKCVKNSRKITGKVSVSKASVKIKVGKKSYKKALVKGKKFTLALNYRLKRNTKITVKVEKKGYKSHIRIFKVK